MATTRVLVADDDDAFSQYLCTLIDDTPGMVVVGRASDGIGALQALERELPDVVALDIDMPRLDGVEAARMIMERHPEVGVVLFSGTDRSDVEFVRKSDIEGTFVDAVAKAAAESRRLRVIRL